MNAHKHLIAAGLLATLAFTSFAQSTPGAAAAPAAASARTDGQGDGRFDPAKRQERMAKRQAELKQKLEIASGQEAAWTSFTNAMKPSGTLQRPDRATMATLSTPDRIDQMRALRTQRIAEMDRRGDATKAFYATLSVEQKKVFDSETLRHGRHGGHHGQHHKG